MLTNMIKKDEPVLVIPLGNDTRERPGSLSEEKVRIVLLYLRPYLGFGPKIPLLPLTSRKKRMKGIFSARICNQPLYTKKILYKGNWFHSTKIVLPT